MGGTANTKVIALERRLATDALTPEDKERFELARRLRKLRKDGLTVAECAAAVGRGERMVQQFMLRGVYKTFVAYLEALEGGEDAKAVEKQVRDARTRFAGLAPDALEYFESCYRRKPNSREWADDAKAMWATERVAKGLGLTEPDKTVRPVVNINIGAITAEMRGVAEDDALAARAAGVIDVTPTPVEADAE